MCYECYKSAGSPTIVNDKTKKAAELINRIYEQEGCGAGGYAHIVVDDWNLDDSSIDFCINDINNGYSGISEEGKMACYDCLIYLKQLSEDERYSAMAISCNFLTG